MGLFSFSFAVKQSKWSVCCYSGNLHSVKPRLQQSQKWLQDMKNKLPMTHSSTATVYSLCVNPSSSSRAAWGKLKLNEKKTRNCFHLNVLDKWQAVVLRQHSTCKLFDYAYRYLIIVWYGGARPQRFLGLGFRGEPGSWGHWKRSVFILVI